MVGSTITHYRILEKLGAGGMGEVFKAEDLSLGRVVALKFLPPAMVGDRHAIERLRREARAASVLNHPGICTIHAIEESDGQQFIAMEYLDGEPLSALIANGPLPLETLVPLAIQIADALEVAHGHGIVHRDIKPANIFVTRRRQQAKILDFGLVKMANGQTSTDSSSGLTMHSEALTTTPGMTVGTIAYMSPEQARGETLDARTDLFSFGLVLYEMATGKRAFGGNTTAVVFDAILNRTPQSVLEVNPSMPADFDRIVGKAVEKDRQLRYQSALDLRTDLQRLKRDAESSARVPVASRSVVAAGLSSGDPAIAEVAASSASAAASASVSAASVSAVAEVPAVTPLPSGMVPQAAPTSSGTVPAASGLSKALMAGALFSIIALIAMVAYLSGRIQERSTAPSQTSAPAAASGQPATPTEAIRDREIPEPAPATAPAPATRTAAAPSAVAPTIATEAATVRKPDAAATKADAAAALAVAAELEDIRGKLASGQNAPAIAALNLFLERNPSNRLTPDAYLLLGQAYEATNRNDEAVAAYASVAEKFKTSPRAPEALFRQAQRVLRSRQPQKEMVARNLYTTAADAYPTSEWAPRALLARAEIEDKMRERVMDKAIGAYVPFELVTYRTIAEKYPSYSEDALWKMSEMLEDLNRYPLQAQALTDLVDRFPQTKYEAAWKLGEVREKRLKNKSGAAEAYAKVPATSSKYRDAQKKAQELSRP